MGYAYCGTYTGAVTANQDLLTTLKTSFPNIRKVKGFYITTSANTEITLNEKSKCMTIPVGDSFFVNIDTDEADYGIDIKSMIFGTACNITSLNFYYDV